MTVEQDDAHLLALEHQLEMQPVRCAACGDVDYSNMLHVDGELWILCRSCYAQRIRSDLLRLHAELAV